MKPFAIHPAPWTIQNDYTAGDNCETIAGIIDRDGEAVAIQHPNWFAFEALWTFYQELTAEQIEALGQDAPQEPQSLQDNPPQPGDYLVFVNPEHFLVADGDLYRVPEKYPSCVQEHNNKDNFFHRDEFGPKTQWRPPTSQELYKHTGKTE